MKTLVETTGAAIKAARGGMTQMELAARLGAGWTQKKISLIESGKQPPHVGEVEQIAEALQCDLKELLIDAVERMRRSKSA